MQKQEVEFAMRVYRAIGDVGMVWTLEEFKDVEDRCEEKVLHCIPFKYIWPCIGSILSGSC